MDISKPSSVEIIQKFQAEKGGISAVFHLAGIIEDEVASGITSDSFKRVFASKAHSLDHLIHALKLESLKIFVGFSSIALLTGNSRQANYCGANAYLEARLNILKDQGAPALTVHVGAIRDAGMVEKDLTLRSHIENTGLSLISTKELFAGVVRAVYDDVTNVTIASSNLNWSKWRSFEVNSAKSPRFKHVLADLKNENSNIATLLFDELFKLDAEARHATLNNILSQIVAPILRLDSDQIDSNTTFSDLGVDSLMAAEIQRSIKKSIGLEISVLSLISKRASLSSISENELKKVSVQ